MANPRPDPLPIPPLHPLGTARNEASATTIAAITCRREFTGDNDLAYLRILTDGIARNSAEEFRRAVFETLRAKEEAPRIVAFVHGYNTDLADSLAMLRAIDANITSKLPNAVTVGFLWPSEGKVTSYIADRHRARQAAPALYAAIIDTLRFVETTRCPAELCVIAHSMGNFVLAEAARFAWEAQGKPTTYNVFSEVLMVAPDLDGGALEPGGEALAIPVFGRRVTVYHSRQDHVLLASSAKRVGVTGARLGRQGPDSDRIPNNVVVVDATRAAVHDKIGPHSAYFWAKPTLDDMVAVLQGTDRNEIEGRVSKGSSWVLAG